MNAPVVLVIRSYDNFSAQLVEKGCTVLNLELIRTEPVEDLADLANQVSHIADYDGLFITSPVAARVFLQQFDGRKPPYKGKVYVLGERANELLKGSGFDVVYRGSANTAEELIQSFGDAEFAGKDFLFIRGDKSLRTIQQLLRSSARIEEVIVYRTIENRPDALLLESVRRQLERGTIDWICFFSPSGVECFAKLLGSAAASGMKIAAIGNTTARYASSQGMRVELISPQARSLEFASALIEYSKNSE